MAIAISTIQIATIQTIAIAKPVSNLNQIATEVSVHTKLSVPGMPIEEHVGAIVKKDRKLYSVLLKIQLGKETKHIITYDSQKHPILAIKNYSDFTIVQFRSSKNYRVVAIGDSKTVGNNDEIYVSGHRSGKIFIQPNRVLYSNDRVFLYDSQQDNSERNNELLFNDRSELIGFHSSDKWSIDDEDFWPKYGDYTYPTIQSLAYLYHSAMTAPECSNGLHSATRRAAIAMRDRYYTGATIASLNLPLTKLSLRGKNKQNHQFQPSKNEGDSATILKIIMSDGDRQETTAALDRAIQIGPLNADLYAIRGNARIKSAWYEDRDIPNDRKMLADFDRAISLNPQDIISLFLRTKLKEVNKDYTGALADLDRLVALQPNSSAVYYYRGYLRQHHLKDFAGALADYNRLVELNPNDPRAYLGRGLLQEQDLQNFQAALVDYNRVLEIQRTSTTDRYPEIERTGPIYYLIGRLKAGKIHDFKGALADFDRAISGNKNPNLYQQRAEVKAQLKDFNGAIADYNLAVSNFLLPDSYVLRAKFKVNYLKDIAGALEDYDRAVGNYLSDGKTYYERGMFMDTYRKDRPAAKADFQKAIELLNDDEYKSGTDLELLKKIKLALGN
jgi:tetratricopeptide (TPR) repeat protein